MIYLTNKTINIVLSSVIVLILTFILYPSILVAILPSTVLLYLLVHLTTFKPKISVTSYITPTTINFGQHAKVYINIRGFKKTYIEIYDSPPSTVEIVKGKPCYKGILDKNKKVEYTYSITPLTPGVHIWNPLRIHIRDSLELFEEVVFFNIPRSLNVKMPKISIKLYFKTPAYKIPGMKEHYEPLFDKVRPYAPGDSLKRVVSKSILMPGGLRVKSFISEAYGKVFKPQELKVTLIISREFVKFFRKATNLALHGIYRVYIKSTMLGRSFTLVLNGVPKHVRSLDELYKVLKEYKGISGEELLAMLKKGVEGIVIVDYLTLFKIHRELLKNAMRVLVIMPIPNNYELLNEVEGLRRLLKEFNKKHIRDFLTLNIGKNVYLVSNSLDFERFLEEVL